VSPALTLARGRGLASRGGRRAAAGAAFLVLGLVLATLPTFASDYTVLVGYRVLEYAALAQAWNLLAGYGGLVSLGSAAFIGIGSYATAEITIHSGVPLVPAMLGSGAAAAAFAVIVSVPLFRLRGLYFAIGTLTLAEALRIWMVNWNGFGGASGQFLTDTAPGNHEIYYLSLVVLALATALVAGVLRTRLGVGLRAVRDNEDVAQEMGLSTFRTKLWAFALAASVMGAVGGMQAARLSAIEPYGAFNLQWTIDIVNIAIVGGLGTIAGPLAGAAFVIILGELLADYPELHVAITGAILIAVIRFAPRGLWGTLAGAGLPAPLRLLARRRG